MVQNGSHSTGVRDAALVPLAVFGVLTVALILAWQYVVRLEEEAIREQTTTIAKQTAVRIEEYLRHRLSMIETLCEESSHGHFTGQTEFEQAAIVLHETFPGYQAINWIDADGIIRWVVPLEGNRDSIGHDVHDHPGAGDTLRESEATLEPRITPPLDLLQGGRGVAAYYPVIRDGRLRGHVNGVFRVDHMVTEVLAGGDLEGFPIRIVDGEHTVHVSEPWVATPPDTVVSRHALTVGNRGWRLEFAPSPALAASPPLGARTSTLVVGLLLAAGVAWLTRVAVIRRLRFEDSERRLRALLGSLPDVVIQVDRHGTILGIHGLPSRPTFGDTIPSKGAGLEEILDPSTAARIRQDIESGRADRETVVHEVRLGEGDERRWYELRVVPSGENEALLIIRDVTKRHRTEMQRRRLSMLVEASDDFIAIASANGRLLFLNRAGRALIGLGPDEDISGLRIVDLHPSSEQDRIHDIVEYLQTADSWRGPLPLKHSGTGEAIAAELRAYGIRDPRTGEIEMLAGIARDLRERQHLEAQLRQAQKMEAIGRLAGGLAHDFNNLLTAVAGYAELARIHPELPEEIRQTMEEISSATVRGSKLTGQLLTFSRQQIVKPRALDLNQVVLGTEDMLRRLIRENITLRTDLQPDPWPVLADPGQIDQVLVNLVLNASDSMPDGGVLTLRTRNAPNEDRGAVVLEVSDTGVGMTAEIQDRIFEPFFTTKDQGKGTGLGLAIVYGIVTGCGGTVEVDSTVGGGTTVTLRIPRSDLGPRSEIAPDVRPAPAEFGETILLVEDDERVRRVTVRLLESVGFSVYQAADGREALERVAEAGPDGVDLVLTDIIMPGMGGRELVERLRADHPDLPVLFTSGYTDAIVDESDLDRLSVAFLPKPYTLDALLEKLRDVLAR